MKQAGSRLVDLYAKTKADALIQRPVGLLRPLCSEGYHKQSEPINFSVKWIQKDLTYAKQLSGKTEFLFLEKAIKIYDAAISAGLGESDWTKITQL